MAADVSARALLCAAALALPLVLAGCSGESIVPTLAPPAGAGGASSGGSDSGDPATADADADADASGTPAVTQADSCEWDAPKLDAGVPSSIPSGAGADVQTAIVGSWQHTHFDSGAGFEALDGEDIRFVFSSPEALRYCQHVPGITDHAENAAAVSWEGNRIVLPGAAPGYVVESWDTQTMVWLNLLDNSRYLLQRR